MAVDFFPKKGVLEGLTNDCRACISVRGKVHYERTADQQRTKAREWYQNHKEHRKAYYDSTRAHHNEMRRAARKRDPEKFRAWERAWALKDPLVWRKDTLRRRGLTLEAYDALLATQGGVCAICGGPPLGGKGPIFHIDHDHASGEVRGLLCGHCNIGLGRFRDNPAFLQAAISYLTRP